MMMNEGESCHSRAAAIPDSTHSRASVNLIAPRRLPTPGPEPQEEESSVVDTTTTNHQGSKNSQRLKEEEEGAVVFGKPQAVQLVGGQLVPRLPKRLPTPGPTDTDDAQEDGLVPPRRMPTPGATDDDEPQEQQQPYQSPVHGAVMPQFQFFSRRASFVLPERYGTPMIPEQNEDDDEEDGVDWRGNGIDGPRMAVPSPLDFNNSEEFSQITEPSLMQQPQGAQGGEHAHHHQHHAHQHHGFSRSAAPEPEEEAQEPEEAEAQDPTPTVSPVPSGGAVHHHHNNNNRPMRIPAMYKHDEDENMGASARMERMVLLPPTRMDTPASNQMDNPSEEAQEQPPMPAEDNNTYYNFYEQQQQHPMMHHQLQPPQVYIPDGQEMPHSNPNGWNHHPHNMGHPHNNHWNQDNMGAPHPHPNNWNHPHNLLAHAQYSINNPMMMPPPNAAPMMIMNPHTMSPNNPRSNNQWPNPMLQHHQPNPFMASAPEENNNSSNDAALGTSLRSMPNNNNSNGSSRRSSGGQMSNPYLEQDNLSLSQSLRSSSNHSGRLVAPNALHAKPKKTSSDTTASSSRRKQQQKKKRRESQTEDHPPKDSPHKPERRPTNVLGYFPLGGQPKNHKQKGAPHKPDRRPTMATTLLSPLPVRQGSDSNSNRSRLRKLQDQNAQRLGRMHSSTGDIQKMQRFLQHNTSDSNNHHQEDASNFSWFGNSSIGGGHNKNTSSKSNTVFDLNDQDGIPGSILVVSGVQENDNNDPRRNDSTRAVRDNTSHNALLLNSTHAQKQTRRSSTLTEEEGSEEGMDQYHEDGFHAEGGGCCHSHHHHHHHHPEPDTLLGNMPNNNNNNNPTHLIQQTLQDAIANLGGMATVFPTGAQNRGSGLFGRNRPGGRNSLHKMEDSSYRSSGRQRLDDSKRTQSTLSSTFGGGSTIASEFTRMEIAIVQPPKPWQCVCGLEHDEEYRFCGFCGTSKYWTCASCRFDRNKCQFNHCGGCGVRRNINNGNGNKAGTGNNHHSNAMAA